LGCNTHNPLSQEAINATSQHTPR